MPILAPTTVRSAVSIAVPAEDDAKVGAEPDIRDDAGGIAEPNDADGDAEVDVEPDISGDAGGMAKPNNVPTADADGEVDAKPDMSDEVSGSATREHARTLPIFMIQIDP